MSHIYQMICILLSPCRLFLFFADKMEEDRILSVLTGVGGGAFIVYRYFKEGCHRDPFPVCLLWAFAFFLLLCLVLVVVGLVESMLVFCLHTICDPLLSIYGRCEKKKEKSKEKAQRKEKSKERVYQRGNVIYHETIEPFSVMASIKRFLSIDKKEQVFTTCTKASCKRNREKELSCWRRLKY